MTERKTYMQLNDLLIEVIRLEKEIYDQKDMLESERQSYNQKISFVKERIKELESVLQSEKGQKASSVAQEVEVQLNKNDAVKEVIEADAISQNEFENGTENSPLEKKDSSHQTDNKENRIMEFIYDNWKTVMFSMIMLVGFVWLFVYLSNFSNFSNEIKVVGGFVVSSALIKLSTMARFKNDTKMIFSMSGYFTGLLILLLGSVVIKIIPMYLSVLISLGYLVYGMYVIKKFNTSWLNFMIISTSFLLVLAYEYVNAPYEILYLYVILMTLAFMVVLNKNVDLLSAYSVIIGGLTAGLIVLTKHIESLNNFIPLIYVNDEITPEVALSINEFIKSSMFNLMLPLLIVLVVAFAFDKFKERLTWDDGLGFIIAAKYGYIAWVVVSVEYYVGVEVARQDFWIYALAVMVVGVVLFVRFKDIVWLKDLGLLTTISGLLYVVNSLLSNHVVTFLIGIMIWHVTLHMARRHNMVASKILGAITVFVLSKDIVDVMNSGELLVASLMAMLFVIALFVNAKAYFDVSVKEGAKHALFNRGMANFTAFKMMIIGMLLVSRLFDRSFETYDMKFFGVEFVFILVCYYSINKFIGNKDRGLNGLVNATKKITYLFMVVIFVKTLFTLDNQELNIWFMVEVMIFLGIIVFAYRKINLNVMNGIKIIISRTMVTIWGLHVASAYLKDLMPDLSQMLDYSVVSFILIYLVVEIEKLEKIRNEERKGYLIFMYLLWFVYLLVLVFILMDGMSFLVRAVVFIGIGAFGLFYEKIIRKFSN